MWAWGSAFIGIEGGGSRFDLLIGEFTRYEWELKCGKRKNKQP